MKAEVRMTILLVLKDKEWGREPGYVGSLKKVEKAKKWVSRASRKKCNNSVDSFILAVWDF